MKASDLEKKLGKKKHKTTSELKQVVQVRPGQNPNFCLFLGAGASRSSGIRTASEMVNEWRTMVYRGLRDTTIDCSVEEMKEWLTANAPEWYDQQKEYSCLIERVYSTRANRRLCIENEVADKIPSIGYAYLVRIAEAGLLRTLFTTNFDDLLNEAFYQFSAERALVCAHDSSIDSISISSRRTKIIKLHGDYLFDDLKNTGPETDRLGDNMRVKFREFLKENGLIIAGYSGSDKSITRNLEELLEDPVYLRNGLYWCFRAEDNVNEAAIEILQKSNSFYVLTPGFDELMADFYSMSAKDTSPFSSKLATDRASRIIETYLQNAQLKATKSGTIKRHLEELESDKNASVLSDLLKDLNTEHLASSGLSEKNLLVFLEIERALKDRNPELALARLGDELFKAVDRRFKELLLRRQFQCCTRLNRFSEAKKAANQMLSLEPANFYMSLNECSLIEKRADRLKYLENLRVRHPFSAPVLNAYAGELIDALEHHDKLKAGTRMEDVVAILKRSLDVDPTLENDAWSQLFDFQSRQGSGAKVRDELSETVDKHLAQDAYDSRTSSILFRYCRKFKTTDYKSKPLFDYLQEAYTNHFPRDYAAHLEVFVDACIEFNAHRLLRPLLEDARQNEYLKDDPRFAVTMMDVYYDVFRDLAGGLSHGHEFLKRNNGTSVEVKVLRFYLRQGAPQKARELHKKLKGAIDTGRWLRLEAEILEYDGRYQDAIDAIESLPDRRDFDERFTTDLSFLELKMGAPAKAVKRTRTFLEERSFSASLWGEIINYEYGKKMDRRSIDKKRVSSVAQKTDDGMVKGVCHSLLDEDKEAINLFRAEAEKRFSKIEDCLRWPVVSRHQKELQAIRDDLVKAKRGLNDLPAD
jgi:hypothetical protein